MFDWDDLRFVLAVHRAGSTLAAAKALKVSQTTVARRIEAFEKAIASPLFERRPEGYRATPRALAIIAEAERMEAAATAVANQAAAWRRGATATIRITATELVASLVVAPLVAELRHAHPGLTVEIHADDRKLDLRKGEADIAIRVGSRPPDDSLIGRRLPDSIWAPYCSREYAERHGLPHSIGELAQHQLVAGSGQMESNPALHWLLSRAPGAAVAARCNSLPNLIASVRAGLGVSMLPCFVAAGDPQLMRCLDPSCRWSSEVWLIYHQNRRNDPDLRIVLDAIIARMERLRPRFEGEAVV